MNVHQYDTAHNGKRYVVVESGTIRKNAKVQAQKPGFAITQYKVSGLGEEYQLPDGSWVQRAYLERVGPVQRRRPIGGRKS